MTVVQYQVNQPVSSGWGYYGYRNITIQAKPNYVPVSFHRIHFVQKESNHGERKRRNRKTSAACDNAGRNYQIVHKRVFSGDVFRVSDVVWSGSRSAAVINACEYSGISGKVSGPPVRSGFFQRGVLRTSPRPSATRGLSAFPWFR